jgi:transposase
MIREVDDLELIECGTCHGQGTINRPASVAATGDRFRECPECFGDGMKVVHRVKWYEVGFAW